MDNPELRDETVETSFVVYLNDTTEKKESI